MHNTEPIISAPGNGDGIDHCIPWGTWASVPTPPPIPSICRWAGQAARSAGFNSAAFIVVPSLGEKQCARNTGRRGNRSKQ